MSSQLLWDDLVSTALVGTGRRAVAAPAAGSALAALAAKLPADEEGDAARLLDLAALAVVHRRAGLRAGQSGDQTAECAVDPRPEPAHRASVRLRVLLAGGGDAALVAHWIAEARSRGLRAPAGELPLLLDAAKAHSELRPDVAELAGPRGRWLARLNRDWAWLAVQEASVLDPGDDLWAHGLPGERLAHLHRLRDADPDAARRLLEDGWRRETAEDRARLLAVLHTRLGGADEEFLEQVLDDRAAVVRSVAAGLLAVLPGSAYAGRMAARARECLRPSGRTGVTVLPPDECDAAMRRDGIAAKSPTGRDDRAWWLGEIIAATDPAVWTEVFGETPEEITARRLPRRLVEDVRDGWARAAITHRAPGWVRALAGRGAPAKLLGVLDPDERAAHVARRIDQDGLSEAFQLLAGCPAPWPAGLGDAVLGALERAAADGSSYPWSFSGVTGLAARSLDPSCAGRVQHLAATSGRGRRWQEAFEEIDDLLRQRLQITAEFG